MSTGISGSQVGNLRAGTLLVAPGTMLPANWQLDPEPVVDGWLRVSGTFNDRQLDRELGAAGWTFYFRAGAIKARAFGRSTPGNVAAGLMRLTAEARRQACNCLQIDAVKIRSFLGLPYVRMAAHSRHIRKDTA